MNNSRLLGSHLRHGLLVLPLAGGAVLGKVSDTHPITALILLFEPMLWWAAIHISIWLFIKQQKRLGVSFLLSSAAGLMLLNHPIHRPVAIEANPQVTDDLRKLADCTQPNHASTVPIRVLQWHVDASDDLGLNALEISRLQPDVLVLQGLSNFDIAERTADIIDGEVLTIPASNTTPAAAVVVRGQFDSCGEDGKALSFGHSTDQTGIIWIRPILTEAGATPIALVHVATPFESGSVDTWHRNIEASIATIRATTSAIKSNKTIVLGSFAAPRTFHQLNQTMLASGLQEATIPASWPSGFKMAPLPGLIALDRLWTGADWNHANSRRIRTLSQPRALLLTDLNPSGSSTIETEFDTQVHRQR